MITSSLHDNKQKNIIDNGGSHHDHIIIASRDFTQGLRLRVEGAGFRVEGGGLLLRHHRDGFSVEASL